jgi:small subunit ribosomal protein S11
LGPLQVLCGFKISRKAPPYASQRAAVDAIRTVGLQRVEVMVKGDGSGIDATLRAIAKSGVRLSCTRFVTPMVHNGCRPPTKDACKKLKPLSREINISLIK